MIVSDPLFKGCTRPPMTMGVPTVPLGVVVLSLLMLGIWFDWRIMVLIPFAVLYMRHIVATDDQQFRLLWLKMYFRLIKYNRNGAFWRASCFSPLSFGKRKARK